MTMRLMTDRRPNVAAAALLALCAGAAQADIIDPELQRMLADAEPNQTLSVLVYLDEQLDAKALTAVADAQRLGMPARHELVVRSLHSLADRSQGALVTHLQNGVAGGDVAEFQPFWVANLIHIDARPAFIEALAERLDVGQIYPDYHIELVAPVKSSKQDDADGPRAAEQGVQAIRADDVWALGITGAGVLVSTVDTGVDGNHPALASRWAGTLPQYAGHPEWAWLDPYTYNNNFPFDAGWHGTHTMGTVCGGAPGDEVGVAPGAYWISAGAIDRASISQTVSDAIESFQWIIDPDGDPGTNWDVPAVCSNSWGLTSWHGYPACDQTFWSFLDNCQAAGIAMVFAAGNEGSSPYTLRRPGDRATDEYHTMAVAAVDAYDPNWNIAYFSSRGPSNCTPDGSTAIKPDIAAPGVSVRSSVPGGSYWNSDGTSMASPHVAGVIALMREANPNLTPEEMMQIIYDTAYDLGSNGKDNTYGYGMIDAYAAVLMALDLVDCPGDFNGDGQRDQYDLGHLLGSYGQDDGGDLDGDGDTDQAELGELLGVYGVPCP